MEEYRISRVERHGFEDVISLHLERDGVAISVEVPTVVLEELGAEELREGERVEVEVGSSRPELEEWDIVMRGRVFDVKEVEGERVLYASFGGLQFRLRAEDLPVDVPVGGVLYFAMRLPR